MQTTDFVEDWLCYKTTLGEGAYGEVKLLIHKVTEEKIACKIINHDKHKNAAKIIEREIIIHKKLDHENIIKFFGRRQEPTVEYLFLEYASGGELFQLIEPDVGMPYCSVQKYMKQLLCGVKYLHSTGIAHRDIKPENLLIDGNGVLKISDFGLATLFRYKGKERLLDKKCGTRPYLAPEVLLRPYRAQPADIWSCGIVFVAMLTGELPWAEPHETNEEFLKWKKDVFWSSTPWTKLSNTTLSLTRQILSIDVQNRATIEQIEKHPWMKCIFRNSSSIITSSEGSIDVEDGPPSKKRCHSLVEPDIRLPPEMPTVALSQPVMRNPHSSILQAVNAIRTTKKDHVFFSQPIHNDDLMIQLTQNPITRDNFHNLVKRLTRFYVKTELKVTLEMLSSVLDTLHYTWATDVNGGVSVSTVDLIKNQLNFKILPIDIDGKILLDFRLTKGCGLQFKKKFLRIKECCCEIIDQNS